MNLTIGENGILTKASWASFVTEMAGIREKVNMEKVSKEVEGNLFSEDVIPDDLPDSLKREIVYINNGMKTGKSPKDYNEGIVYAMVDKSGALKDYHYISSNVAGKSKKYIYDENRDIIYKVSPTNIKGITIHSYEYGRIVFGDGNATIKVKNYVIKEEPDMLVTKDNAGNDIAYYAPNLSGFNTRTTNLIYYQKDDTTKFEETNYLCGGNRTFSSKNKEYCWYDYGSKIWANVKCNNNDVITYWVWIPRYAYKILDGAVDVKYITLENKYYDSDTKEYKNLDEDYIVAAAFSQNGNKKGIWMSKYEPALATADYKESTDRNAVNKPNLNGFDKENTYYITYDSGGNEKEPISIKNIEPDDWYDYTNKKWANIMCNNNGVITYWVWIPRYAYRIENGIAQIIYIDTDNNPLDSKYKGLFTIGVDENCDFKVIEGFRQNGKELDGIWISKYEPSEANVLFKNSTDAQAVNKPNLTGFDKENTYYVTYDSEGNEQKPISIKNNVPEDWYDYTRKKWANVMCDNNGVKTYWVWIPRYAYSESSGSVEIIYVDKNNNPLDEGYKGFDIGTSPDSEYRVMEAFRQNGKELDGIWVSKYEPSKVEIP